MSYEFLLNTEPEVLDSFVMSSEQNSLFQCSPWASIKSNWEHLYTAVKEDGKVVGAALVLVRTMPLGLTLFYIPRGPVMDYSREDLVRFYFDELKKAAKKRKAIAIRFDPAVLSRRYSYRDRNEEHAYENTDVIDMLKRIGARHKGYTTMISEATQPRYNAEMDVTPDYRDHLEHRTTKCIRAALHKGIEVYEGAEYLHDFAEAMHYTEVRKGVALRNEEYFRNMMEVYGDHAICMVAKLNFPRQLEKLIASVNEAEEKLKDPSLKKKEKAALNQQLTNDRKELEKLQADYEREGRNEVITCGILAAYNDNLMELFYMGNNPDYLRMYSSYLLYALCLDRCVDLGITHCSFGGIEGTLDDGLTLFKSNWLMNVEEYIGEFNIVLNGLMYKAFDEIYPKVLAMAAKYRGRK